MEIYFYGVLFIFGCLFGSFASVVIYRLKLKKPGILNGRSNCPKCKKTLGILELIPVFSWIKNLGKCKYCKNNISLIYPFLEISTGILFSLIGYFLIDYNLLISGNITEIIKLFFWLVIGFITIIYSFYDILFLEIHDGIMLFSIIFVFIFLIFESLGITNIFSYLNYEKINFFELSFGLLILILSIMFYYVIMFKELSFKYDFLILFVILFLNLFFILHYGGGLEKNIFINTGLGAFIIFLFLFIQIAISGGTWMGGGDLRIAILIGLILGVSFSIEGLFLTYIIGSIIGVFLLTFYKIKNGIKAKFNTEIPFGPFLALGFFTIIFLQKSLTEIIKFYL